MVTIANFREEQYPLVEGTRCIQVYIPDDDVFKHLLAGLIALAGSEGNYVQDDPDKSADLAQQWRNAYLQSDWTGCNPMLPVGTIVQFGSANQPDGWLYCDGNYVLKADYPLLWDAIGTLWGTAPDSDYFVLPDFRNRSPYGYDVGTVPPHFTFASSHGAETHTLTTAQIPAHDHDMYSANVFTLTQAGATGAGIGGAVPFNPKTGSTGGGGAHNNLHPVAVCGFIIYTGA